MGRPKIYASEAERQAAYRARNYRVDLTLDKDLGKTIDDLCDHLVVSRNDLATSLFKFALTNRDWKRLGLTHKAT